MPYVLLTENTYKELWKYAEKKHGKENLLGKIMEEDIIKGLIEGAGSK